MTPGASPPTLLSCRICCLSQFIANGVDIVTISKRLGHAKPSVTLAIYGHMFHTDDRKAAAAINAALGE
jgi:integrase